MTMERMDKAAGNKGSNSVSPKAGGGNRDTIYGPEYTQNESVQAVSVTRLRSADSLSMNVPGQGNVAKAPGAAKEGSARRYADAMDSITGAASVERDASNGDN